MDSGRFDRLARVLAAAPSRRSVLRGVVAAAFGGAVVGRGALVEARVGNRCRNGNCGDNERCNNNDVCVCKSDDGIKQCGNKCVDVRNDNDNCGGCGKECANRKRCVRGKCRRFEDPEDGSCTYFGDCNETPCCAGFACLAGNSARRGCVYVG